MVNEYYAFFGNKVNRDGFGNVSLTRHDIQSSIAHGIGRKKAAAFKAVPDVIKKGFIFGETEDYKNRGYSSIVIDAPIKIAEDEYICEVVINKKEKSNDFYLHEVELKEKLQFGNQVRTYGKEDSLRNAKTGASRLILSKLLTDGKIAHSLKKTYWFFLIFAVHIQFPFLNNRNHPSSFETFSKVLVLRKYATLPAVIYILCKSHKMVNLKDSSIFKSYSAIKITKDLFLF